MKYFTCWTSLIKLKFERTRETFGISNDLTVHVWCQLDELEEFSQIQFINLPMCKKKKM
jgi:hypothetical protein